MASSPSLKVLVAESHRLDAEALSIALGSVPDLDVADARPLTGPAAVKAIAERRPDVAVVDCMLPGMDPDAVVASALAHSPGTRILSLARDPDDVGSDSELRRAGAAGLAGSSLGVSRRLPAGELAGSIRWVASGCQGQAPGPSPTHTLEFPDWTSRRFRRASSALARLSPRQLEVLQLLGAGLSTREVGRRLRITTGTVNDHVHAILTKLHVGSKLEALAMARATGFVTVSHEDRATRPETDRSRRRSTGVRTLPPPTPRPTVTVSAQGLFGTSLIAALQQTTPVLEVFDCCGGSEEAAIEQVLHHRPDVALIDLDLAMGMSGTAAAEAVFAALPAGASAPAFILLAVEPTPRQVAAAFAAGATGVLTHASPITDLVSAVHDAHAGRFSAHDEALLQLLGHDESLQRDREVSRQAADAVSTVELEVLLLLDRGQSPKQIARALSVQVATVKKRIERFRAKMGARTQLEALAMARQGGILPAHRREFPPPRRSTAKGRPARDPRPKDLQRGLKASELLLVSSFSGLTAVCPHGSIHRVRSRPAST